MSFLSMGTVYGTLMNFRAEHAALAAQMDAPPYKAPPQAPILYIKPANTRSAEGAAIAVPPGVTEAEVWASVAIVMKAPGEPAGYVLVNDLTLPHASFYRPPVKAKCQDGFLGVGSQLLPAGPDVDPAQFKLEVRINGALCQTVDFSQMLRSASQLLADVTEFMTLGPGDLLLLGSDVLAGGGRPKARVGDHIEISAPGLGKLTNTLTAVVAGAKA